MSAPITKDLSPSTTPAALAITGALTSNGSAAVVFPPMLLAGTSDGRPVYTSTGSATTVYTGDWYQAISVAATHLSIRKYTGGSVVAEWRSSTRPEQFADVATWTAQGSATGTPVIDPMPAAPPASVDLSDDGYAGDPPVSVDLTSPVPPAGWQPVVVISGTLTDGTDPVEFPPLLYTGENNNQPIYEAGTYGSGTEYWALFYNNNTLGWEIYFSSDGADTAIWRTGSHAPGEIPDPFGNIPWAAVSTATGGPTASSYPTIPPITKDV